MDSVIFPLRERRKAEFMTTLSRFRRAATAGGCALTALAAAGTAQAAAAPHAGLAASRQDAPGVSPMKVRSVAGPTTPGITTDSFDNCSAGYFCLAQYESPQTWVSFLPNATLHGGGYSFPWGSCGKSGEPAEPGCDAGIHAFANNTGDRVWLKATTSGGSELCISNHEANADYNGVADEDYWVQITENPNPCT
jgi:hypothetical protein